MKHVAKLPFTCFALLGAGYIARMLWIFSQVREPIAVHFTLSGDMDRWATKTEFVVVSTLVSGVVLGLFGGLALFGSKMPDDISNLPHKEYWFAPERRDRTHRILSALLSWLGCGAVVLLGTVNESLYRTNATGESAMSGAFWWVMAITLGLVVTALLVWRRFRIRGRDPGLLMGSSSTPR